MKTLKTILLFIIFVINANVLAIIPSQDLKTIISNKDLYKPLAESEYKEVIDRISSIYSAVIKDKYSANLIFDADWKDETINAYATRPVEGEFHIFAPGGMARAHGMTKNSWALVLCHELGHHLGGAPRTFRFSGWPAAEGQADYFATSKCLKNYFSQLAFEEVALDSNIPEKVMSDCNLVYKNFSDLKVCVKTQLASLDFANFLNSFPSNKLPVKLETPDTREVKGTNLNDYPKPQCRFDTLYQGALCSVSASELTSETDPNVASCIDYQKLGARPKCWYKP